MQNYTHSFKTNIYHYLALFKVAFTKYLRSKYNDKINVNKQIIKLYEKNEKEIIIKTFKFINQFVENQVKVANSEERTNERMFKFLFTWNFFL